MLPLVLIGVMVFVAGIFICYRILVPPRAAPTRTDASLDLNVSLYRERIAELESDAGAVDAEASQRLRTEAQLQLLADQREPTSAISESPRSGAGLLGITAVLMLTLAGALYYLIGGYQDLRIRDMLDDSSVAQQSELAAALKSRLEQRPDNVYYWIILGRMALEEGETAAAELAYRRALALAPEDANINVALAQILFFGNQRGLADNDEMTRLIATALAEDPHNAGALELAGISAFYQEKYQQAIVYWQQALRFVAGDKSTRRTLQQSIDRAQAKISASDQPALLEVSVVLANEFRNRLPTDAVVFVYVRESQGPPMPLVAQRFTVAELPVKIAFSDAMSLNAARPLSAAANVEIVARVALSGSLQGSAGDLEGRTGPLRVIDAGTYQVIIDTSLPASG